MWYINMIWKVDFYNQELYNKLMRWPNKIKQRFIRFIELIETHGADLGMPHTRTLGDGLFEL